jgi:hypothetical protein
MDHLNKSEKALVQDIKERQNEGKDDEPSVFPIPGVCVTRRSYSYYRQIYLSKYLK